MLRQSPEESEPATKRSKVEDYKLPDKDDEEKKIETVRPPPSFLESCVL